MYTPAPQNLEKYFSLQGWISIKENKKNQ